MFLSRRIDDREIQLKRQNKIFFQISGAGHEAVLAAAGLVLKPGYDWFFPYYRDRALALMLGVTPYEMLLQAVGAKDDPASGGRQMPSHWGNRRLNIVHRLFPHGNAVAAGRGRGGSVALLREISQGAGTGAQGAAGRTRGVITGRNCLRFRRRRRDQRRRILGGAEHGLPAASFPVLFLIEDNGYAISVPVELQTAGGSISKLVREFPASSHRGVRRNGSAGKLCGARARSGALPRAQGPGAGSRARHAAVFAFAFRRRKTLQDRRRSARRKRTATRFRNSRLFLVREGILDEERTGGARSGGRSRSRRSHRPRAGGRAARRRIRFT